jgi:energy-converting hydrogenase A subunit E
MILGSIGTVIGPGVKDPIVRTLNTEIAAVGISMIFLTYNHTIALLTFVASTIIITMILLRAIIRLEEMGAKV